MLTGIVYISNAAFKFDELLLEELAHHASLKYELIGVTGYLYYAHEQFVQYFERQKTIANRLMEAIPTHVRHQVTHVSRQRTVPEQRFPVWGMRWLSDSELQVIHLEHVLVHYFNRNSSFPERMWE